MDASVVAVHAAFDEVEEVFRAALDQSLDPRGPESLFDLVGSLGLPSGASAVDVGCGRGEHSFELAERFGLDVLGIDPVPRYEHTAKRRPSRGSVRFAAGIAESIPVDSRSVDFVFCRESLMFADLSTAPDEFARVLRPGGRGLVYLVLTGTMMSDDEAAQLHALLRAPSVRPQHVDDALTAAGLHIDTRVEYRSEWGERRHEATGEPGRRLLHAARLLREPERYVAQFGRENYEVMLGDCLWHVYRMLGKLTGYACTFTRP